MKTIHSYFYSVCWPCVVDWGLLK